MEVPGEGRTPKPARDRRLVQAYSSHMLGERSFVILRYVDAVPSVAGCTKCPLKFFTPEPLHDDSIGAEHYLQGKFDAHRCREEVKVQVVRRW